MEDPFRWKLLFKALILPPAAPLLIALVGLRHVPWIVLPWLGFTLVGAHLVLLAWETHYVSLQLAAPGIRPRTPIPTGEESA